MPWNAILSLESPNNIKSICSAMDPTTGECLVYVGLTSGRVRKWKSTLEEEEEEEEEEFT